MSSLKTLLLLGTLSFLPVSSPIASTGTALGQPGYYGGGQSVTCSSDDGKRNYCNVDTRGGVRLTRQISGSPCVQGQTWGWDNRGVWVDRGCRAEFVTGSGGNWSPGGGQGQTITCSSDDGRRNYCNADVRSGVRLTRQISGSPCTQGQTWGYDNRGIWVDRGCRAEFVTGAGGGGNWGPGGPGNQYQTITCSSDDGRRNYCNADTRGGVRLTRQISGSPCNQGQTWGWDNRGIWVDRGCRAEFVTGAGGGGNWGPEGPGNQYQTITCSSDNGQRNFCSLPYNVNPNNVVLTRQISGSPCNRGSTWGVDRNNIWVDRGCRAEFGFR